MKPQPQQPNLPLQQEIKEPLHQKHPVVVQTHVVQPPRKVLVDRAAQTTKEVHVKLSNNVVPRSGTSKSGSDFCRATVFFNFVVSLFPDV